MALNYLKIFLNIMDFICYDVAEGQNRGNAQTTYNTEYTITARPKQISVKVNWYHVASNKFDFGKFGVKIAKSFESYIQNAVIRGMMNAVTNAADLGIGGYAKIGASKANWIDLAQKVSAANGGADVYALGTLSALGKVIPDDAGFRFMSDDDLVTKGYLPVYNQVPCFELKQAILPTTLNGANPTLIVPDNYIYFIPMSFNKPVKVAFEGNTVTVTTDPTHTADAHLGLTITMRIGVDTIVGSKFGVLTVN